MAGCGVEAAERLLGDLVAARGVRVPDDLGFYIRVAARPLAELPLDRAQAAVARLSGLAGPPSRAELAAACRDAAVPNL